MDFFRIVAFLLAVHMPTVIDTAPIPLEMVDMTYVFDNSTLYWPKSMKFEMVVEKNGTAPGGYWVQTESYFSGTHVGTHMDSPCHFARGRWCIEQIPLDRMIAPAAVIDISKEARENRDYLVQVEDLEKWERLSGRSLDGTVVLLRSGWGHRWPDRESFTGTAGLNLSQLHYPGMSQRASQWLVDNRDIYGIGTECLSFDNGPSRDYMAHRILLDANIFGLENVANMEEIPVYGATLYIMPMKIGNASGAPVRIIATFPKPIFAIAGGNPEIEDTFREIIIFHK